MIMDADKIKALSSAVRNVLVTSCLGLTVQRDEVTILVPRTRMVDVLEKMRDDPAVAMNQLMDISAVDYPARPERFDICYHLLSLKHNWRLRVRTEVMEDSFVPSVVAVYPSAGWYEREIFDLFGVKFEDHPDLRRLLTDYDFEGHPLRRDFPLVGFTQVRYDDAQRRVVKEPVKLEQDYRAFDALSPWEGMTDVQRRGGKP